MPCVSDVGIHMDDAVADVIAEITCETVAVSLQKGGDWSVQPLKGGFCLDSKTLQRSNLCKVMVRRLQPTIVPDCLLAPHLAKDPLVTGASKVRFYAEVPVTNAEGLIVGSLVLADRKPLEDLPEMNLDDMPELLLRGETLTTAMSLLTTEMSVLTTEISGRAAMPEEQGKSITASTTDSATSFYDVAKQ
eukprot:TRINITY_DN66387_c0_g1_i1.p1 TRINITY_DN66387_c0_g1~~TRINITY_DN66387_c0_g1_i1.p1  ORF type:complete len:190 (+),score=33.84 TRINITY_DN66387_c0_g1_i1:52-621(+)